MPSTYIGTRSEALAGLEGLALSTRQASIKSFLDWSEFKSLESLIESEIALNLEPGHFLKL